MRVLAKWQRARTEREKLEAAAECACVTIVRDGRGHVIAAR
jgi:hypothetical protein